ncbi:MAG: hypothetical protein PHF97_01840 [Bacteroidales bacterium]|nr:hypothetical protein [Bacteroidales bacterium]
MKTTFHFLKNALLVLTVVVFTSGCQVIMKFKYGIKQPHEETPEKLISFLHHEKFPDTNLFLFKDSAAYIKALNNNMIRKNLLSHMIFDRNGALLERDTTQCQWAGYYFIKQLSPDSLYPTGTGITLNDVISEIKPLVPAVDTGIKNTFPDFTMIILWGKFLGKYNQRLFILADAVQTNTAAKIHLIYLNIDMQKNWHLNRKQKLMIR